MSRRAYHHGDLAAALVEEGLRLVESGDAEGASLRAVARGTGVSAAAVYRHFADKEALLAAVAGRGFASLNAVFAQALTGARRRTPLGRLRALGLAYIDFALARPGLYQVMFGTARPRVGRDKTLDAEAERAWRHLAEAVAAAWPPGTSRQVLDAATVASWSVVHGYVVLRLEGQLTGVARDGFPDAATVLAHLTPPRG
jgi:AcrR family transcriptional regulator